MKKYILLLSTLIIWACNDDFLEKSPIEKQTEETAFITYDNFKTYVWGMYDVFNSYPAITRAIDNYSFSMRGDAWAGHLCYINSNAPNYYASQTATTFASGKTGYSFDYATGGWDFSYIRRINIMLQNIDASKLTAKDKEHWRSVGYFFRSYLYMELVSRFGDIPWLDKVIQDNSPEAFAPRTPRIEVVDNLMEDLLYAESNIKENGDGMNTINKACVQVLISRLGLFEGTWRKYHNLDDSKAKYTVNKLLTASADASNKLMATFPKLLNNYDDLLNRESLANADGVILYKSYEDGLIMHYMGRYARTSEIRFEVPKHTVELYLTKNGLPIYNTNNQVDKGGEYCGDKLIYNEFRNRDNRMLMSIVPPYFGNPGYDYTPPAEYNINTKEYVELLPKILPNANSKRLPVTNFAGTVINQIPNVIGPGQAPLRSYTGYSTFRLYNLWEYSSASSFCNTADKPIFHIGEVLLNYAEAKWELGEFSQAIADASINKLRKRVGTKEMEVAMIDASFDPVRDQGVDPVLWEIRRERIVELLGEGFGYDDIRRWKKAPWYLNRDVVGCYIRYADYTKNGNVVPAWQNVALVNKDFQDQPKKPDAEGYIKCYPNQARANIGKGWLDKYYLLPLPLNEIALNPKLLPNNPGW